MVTIHQFEMDTETKSLTGAVFRKITKAEKEKLRNYEAKLEYISTEISYDEFFMDYMLANKPCMFRSFVTANWKSRAEWVADDGMPNFDFLEEKFGDATVPVADCESKQYDAQTKQDMTLRDYLLYLRTLISSQYDTNMKCLYLKDWHFNRTFTDYKAYTTPVYFTSDWLNEFWDNRSDQSDDYRFVYMGPKGSWTPFHADVFRSYSWSANVCGRKKWILFPPGQEEHLKDCHGNMAYDVTSPKMHDGKKYPNYHKVSGSIEVIQEAGEAIFVPSGWFHQVFNLEDTISINHNWVNGCNIDIAWKFLQSELLQVQGAISDCKDMDGWDKQCQMILRANSGMDFADFFTFLHTVAKERMKRLTIAMETDSKSALEMNYHDVFDLTQILEVLQTMLENKEFSEVEIEPLVDDPRNLCSVVKEFLNTELAGYL
ncbi:2-oxoglutarate and iron-dependent oxygenase JMJD4-like [Ptychodera flava]|uniref:2-oxoglutarate and iron-dependent oxygenase JMJD4-like n=1 Tax=Ptychodera flava TaxID=63121 RepID=UPI00396A0473